jgi:hypothetical protein
MSFGIVCKKLKWSKWERKSVKKEINDQVNITPREGKKSYVLFKENFGVDLYHEPIAFDASKYIKRDLSSDVIEVIKDDKSDFYKIKSITLYKKVLDKMSINVLSRFIKKAEYYFFDLVGYESRDKLNKIKTNILRANKIFSVIEEVYTPKHKSIFVNLKSEELKEYPNNKIHIFLVSAILFFLDHLHDFFLDLLKKYPSVKISMYNFELSSGYFFEISYRSLFIEEMIFKQQANIFSNEGQLIEKVIDKLDTLVFDFKEYVANNTKERITVQIGSDTWFILRNIALHAFVVYTLAYIHAVLDLSKLFSDIRFPLFTEFYVEISTSNKLDFIDFSKIDIAEDSLLSKVLLDKKKGKIKRNEFLFFTLNDDVTTIQAKKSEYAPLEFFRQKTGGKKEKPFFFLGKENRKKFFNIYKIFRSSFNMRGDFCIWKW